MSDPKNERDAPRDQKPKMVPADSPIGTTHDPNSVTTGTDAEPSDAFPPKTDETKRTR